MAKKDNFIHVIGAREHNLKNISVSIPKDTLTVITGPSGSGKSTLALDVLYTEGKRRYTESLSTYARQFLGIARKPEVDKIDGLCPAISIEQKTVGNNPRSTVGTITEIYDYLRVFFARVATAYCPDCKIEIGAQSPEHISNAIMQEFKDCDILILASIAKQEKGEFKNRLEHLFSLGYCRFIIDEKEYKISNLLQIEGIKLGKTYKHTIDVIVDSLIIEESERSRVSESVEKSLTLSNGLLKVFFNNQEKLFSSKRMCISCAKSFDEIEPRLFSFNSPIGACKFCLGIGISTASGIYALQNEVENLKFNFKVCNYCDGKRLNPFALAVVFADKNIYEICEFSISDAYDFFKKLKINESIKNVATPLLLEITSRLLFLLNVGLGYLTLNRTARTLSGGEGQRIRLATQIGSALSGVLYVLDEPSIGLHQKDNDRLIATLKDLRDQGNSIVVVEHDSDTILASDYVIDMGPEAGINGGNVTAFGTPDEIMKNDNSLTGQYLSGKKSIEIPKVTRKLNKWIIIKNLKKHNLKDITVEIPLNVFCCVSGVSGSGKSTFIIDELVEKIKKEFNRKSKIDVQDESSISGLEQIKSMIVIDQDPIGRTSRSNPATYLGIFDEIRNLFASLPESIARGYKTGRFSFNRPDGRCFECDGDGTVTVSMHFLADVNLICKSCNGKRYNCETLQICFKGKNISQVLDMTIFEARDFFKFHTMIFKKIDLLCSVGLDYLKLGQPSPTLSGGEAQRIKLVDELAKRGNSTLYILDEPTTGLHVSDIAKLLKVFNALIDKGNSIIVIEHNMDVLKTSDYIIDLGPDGGNKGGYVVAKGAPHEIIKSSKSYTAQYLKHFFK